MLVHENVIQKSEYLEGRRYDTQTACTISPSVPDVNTIKMTKEPDFE